MYEIIANAKGSRTIAVNDSHLETIQKYDLFSRLTGSNGIIDEMVLEKLRMNVRSLMENTAESGDLVELCQEVLFHDNMKAIGLANLVALYADWQKKREAEPIVE